MLRNIYHLKLNESKEKQINTYQNFLCSKELRLKLDCKPVDYILEKDDIHYYKFTMSSLQSGTNSFW